MNGNCLTGDVMVCDGTGGDKVIGNLMAGDSVLTLGNDFQCTPNHLVLVDGKWVPAVTVSREKISKVLKMNRWEEIPGVGMHNNAHLVKVVAHIRKNSTGEIRRCETEEVLEHNADKPTVFNWKENNYSCDCNRELFFERAVGKEIDDDTCSHGRFSVNLENPITGEFYEGEREDPRFQSWDESEQ